MSKEPVEQGVTGDHYCENWARADQGAQGTLQFKTQSKKTNDNEQSILITNKAYSDNVPCCTLSLDIGHQAWGNRLRGDICSEFSASCLEVAWQGTMTTNMNIIKNISAVDGKITTDRSPVFNHM